MDLISKTHNLIRSYHLIKRNDTVVVGVSGGPDSVALLHVLHRLGYVLGVRVCAAHFNHKLRRGADVDQKFVERTARELNIPVFVGQWKSRSKNLHKGSLEERARDARFEFFRTVVSQTGADVLALAHHQNDFAETVLMRILRGTGLQGLRSLIPRREIDGVMTVRPFLGATRSDIETFLKREKLKFRVDPTNAGQDFTRNKIRHHLLPLLKRTYNRDIEHVLAHLGETAAVDYCFLEETAASYWRKIVILSRNGEVRFRLSALQKIHPALQRMLIRHAAMVLKGHAYSITLAHFQEIDRLLCPGITGAPGSGVHLPKGLNLRKVTNQLVLSDKN